MSCKITSALVRDLLTWGVVLVLMSGDRPDFGDSPGSGRVLGGVTTAEARVLGPGGVPPNMDALLGSGRVLEGVPSTDGGRVPGIEERDVLEGVAGCEPDERVLPDLM